MSLDDLDQFIQEEPTPEPVSAQAEDPQYEALLDKCEYDAQDAEGDTDWYFDMQAKELFEKLHRDFEGFSSQLPKKEDAGKHITLAELRERLGIRTKKPEGKPVSQEIKSLALRDTENIGEYVCSFTVEDLAWLFITRNKALYMVDEKGNKSPLPDKFPLWFFSEVISIGKAKSFFGTYVVYMPKALENAGFSLDFRKDKSESRGKALSGFIASISKIYSCARVIYDGREFALLNYESRLEDPNYAVFTSPILEYIGEKYSQRKTLPICYTVETKALHIGGKQPLVLEMYMCCMGAIHQRADIPDQQLKQNKGKDLPDKDLRTYRLKVTTLMQDRCPRVWERYSSLGRTTSRNKFLKSKFSALKEKLEQGLSEQYERVSVRFSIPTTSTLSQASIYVFHYGRKQKLTLPPPPKNLGEVE